MTSIGKLGVVINLLRKDSFENLNDWLEEVKSNADSGCILVLIGNKVDTPET